MKLVNPNTLRPHNSKNIDFWSKCCRFSEKKFLNSDILIPHISKNIEF